MKTTLSLEELRTFDPAYRVHGDQQRSLCPLCGESKPRDKAHQCLVANLTSGAWICFRCPASGKLREYWQQNFSATSYNSRNIARMRRSRLSQVEERLPQPATTAEDQTLEDSDWIRHLQGLRPLQGSPGETYLERRRGIPCAIAHQADVRFAPQYYGRPAVVFPISDQAGRMVAVNGRIIDGKSNDKMTAGPKSNGSFIAPVKAFTNPERIFVPLDAAVEWVIVAEAPIDALSLAAAGYPAIALCGTSAPHWLLLACGRHRFAHNGCVISAFDADDGGDKAAEDLAAKLDPYGVPCRRLRPEGAKDWNEMLLQIGRDALCDWLSLRLLVYHSA
jgi:hypothetical protein